jgi:hypothetical protein
MGRKSTLVKGQHPEKMERLLSSKLHLCLYRKKEHDRNARCWGEGSLAESSSSTSLAGTLH